MEHIGNASGKPSVYIRLQPDLFSALAAAASEANLSRAGWVRERIVCAFPNHSDFKLPPSPPARPPTIPASDLAEVSRMSASLSRVGGSVVQLCRALRETGSVSHAEAEATLAELRTVQAAVAYLVARLSP